MPFYDVDDCNRLLTSANPPAGSAACSLSTVSAPEVRRGLGRQSTDDRAGARKSDPGVMYMYKLLAHDEPLILMSRLRTRRTGRNPETICL